MPTCPRCHDEYEPGVGRCATCDLPLVADGVPLPPRVDALLGVFHPVAADPVVALLARRGIAHDVVPSGDTVEVIADRAWRDDLRAELALTWGELVGGLDPESRGILLTAGGPLPGWLDAPEGAWVDRDGRVQVDGAHGEAEEADARRTVGPVMAAIGAVLVVFGWYAGAGAGVVVAGVGLLLVGLLLPR